MNILCFLWPLLAGLICGILGYLLGSSLVSKWKNRVKDLEANLDLCEKNKMKLESDLRLANKNSSISMERSSQNDISIWEEKVSKLEAELAKVKSSSSSGIVGGVAAASLGAVAATSNSNVDIEEWKTKVSSLEADLDLCRKNKLKLETDLKLANSLKPTIEKSSGVVSSLASTIPLAIPFDADAAKVAYGKKIKLDDLKIVEGIGPKIEELFHNYGIKTWKELSETSVEKCQEVLDSGGERYKIHNPGTWPEQAKLAYEGKWKELVKWQDELDGGKI